MCGREEELVGDLLLVLPDAISASTSRSRSDSSGDGCSARAANTVCPRPTVEHRLGHVVGAGESFETKPDAPRGPRRLRRDPAGARDQQHARAAATRAGSPRTARRPTPRRGTGPPAPRAARSAAPARAPRPPSCAVRQRSTQGCSVSSSRKPQCTTSWSSTTSTRRLRSGLIARSSLTGTTRRTRQSPARRGRTPRRRRTWSASTAASRSPMPVPREPPRRAVVADLERRTCPSAPRHVHVDPRGARVLVGVAQRLGEHGLRDRLELDAAPRRRPASRPRAAVLVVAGRAARARARSVSAGVHRRGRERPLERVAQVSERRLHLVRAALAPRRLSAAARRRAPARSPNSRCITRSWISRARSMRARSRRARAPAGGWRSARWPPARRSCPSVHIAWRSSSVSSKRLAAAVGEDHAEPAPAGRHRRAGERGELGEARVARRAPTPRAVARPATTRSSSQRRLGDRRLLEAAVDVRRAARRRARGCPPAPRAGAPRRRASARRASSTPAGRAPRRAGRRTAAVGPRALVELGDQLDDHVERVGARGRIAPPPSACCTRGQAGCSERRSVCSEVSETIAHVAAGAAAALDLALEVLDQPATTRRRSTGRRGRRAPPRRGRVRRCRGRWPARASDPCLAGWRTARAK